MVLLDLPNLVFFAPLLPLLLLATSKTLAMNGSKKLVLGSPVTKHLIEGRTIYIKRDDLLIRMKDEDWLDVINMNLTSVYKLTKNITKQMFKQRHGKIISISSVVGFSGNPGQTNYVSSKSGLVGFTKSLAMEVASRGITVNCVAPGMIDSDMIDSLNEKQKEAIIGRIPMAKLGLPSDVAEACLFLSSHMSGYITGQTIHVNGGMVMH